MVSEMYDVHLILWVFFHYCLNSLIYPAHVIAVYIQWNVKSGSLGDIIYSTVDFFMTGIVPVPYINYV